MLKPAHEIESVHPGGMSPRRAATIGAVGLLHVAAVYALISGMAGEAIKDVPPDVVVRFLVPSAPSTPVPMPPQPTFVHPTIDKTPNIQPPEIKIDDSNGHAIHALSLPPHAASDSAAFGVASTHTTPPYPLDARALGHAGTVLLQITISPQGDVVSATVVQSSGFAELDAEAVAWVTAHWKYKPAIQGGAPVTSQTEAAVKFDLKQARG